MNVGGLQRRIVITSAALALTYAGLLAALVLSGTRGLLLGAAGTVLAAVQIWTADKAALKAIDAHSVTREQEPELHAIVGRLCLHADLPMPRVALSYARAPTAMAVGGLFGRPTIAVDRGLIRLLEPAELEGVLAHELAHVAHKDVTVMTVASSFSVVAGLLVNLSRIAPGVVKALIMAASVVAYALSFLLLRALSRARELAADATAARLTGRPSALASALLNLEAEVARIPAKDLRKIQPVSALAFTPVAPKHWWGALTATHPSSAQRIAALEALERELQRGRG